MKKLLLSLLTLLLILSLPVVAFAYDYSDGARDALLVDSADLLSDEDEDYINKRLEEISDSYGCEIAILTVTSSGISEIQDYAEDYYKENGYGYGSSGSGILMVIDMAKKESAIYANDAAADIFDDDDLENLKQSYLSYLTDKEYKEALTEFCESCESILADNSSPSDGILSEIFSIKNIITAVIIGLAVGFIYTAYLKSRLKSVKAQSSASDYMVAGSLQMTQQRDIFMYSNVKKTPKPKNNSSSGKGSSRSSGGSRSTKGSF